MKVSVAMLGVINAVHLITWKEEFDLIHSPRAADSRVDGKESRSRGSTVVTCTDKNFQCRGLGFRFDFKLSAE